MKKFLFAAIVIILLLIINDLGRSIYDIWHKKDFVTKAEKELLYQKQENQRLKAALSYSKTSDFIEREARDKLFMTKEGEQKILFPRESEIVSESKNDNDPNWKKWWKLFFN